VLRAQSLGIVHLVGAKWNSVTSAPRACASFRPCAPNAGPTMRLSDLLPTFQWRSGEYVVMPAQSSGATAARSRLAGTSARSFRPRRFALNTRHSHAAQVRVRTVVGECGADLAVIFQPALTALTLAAGVDQAADSSQIAFLNLLTCAPPCYAADDLMAGNSGIRGGHEASHSLRTVCRSEWQTPQYRISI